MSATCQIWVGVLDSRLNDTQRERLMTQADGWPTEIPNFERFYSGDEIVGYGIELLNHDWDSETVLELGKLVIGEDLARIALYPLWDELDIPHALKLYLTSDYS